MTSVFVFDAACFFDTNRNRLPIAVGALATLLRLHTEGVVCVAVVTEQLAPRWDEWGGLLVDEGLDTLQAVCCSSLQDGVLGDEAPLVRQLADMPREKISFLGQGSESARVAAALDIHYFDYVEDFQGTWLKIQQAVLFPKRSVQVNRVTSETKVAISLDVDCARSAHIKTGLGFFDHMLEQIARHSDVGLTIEVEGDLVIDEHHTIEDTGLALGEAFKKAVGNKRGMNRYGFYLPMDEAAAVVALDFSGRPSFHWDVSLHREMVGDFPCEMAEHFFQSFASAAALTLRIQADGENDHHTIEAVFKAVGKSLKEALQRSDLNAAIPSTKGTL